jgi:hypothetical protein
MKSCAAEGSSATPAFISSRCSGGEAKVTPKVLIICEKSKKLQR